MNGNQKKKEYVTQSMTEALTHRKLQKLTRQHKHANKNLHNDCGPT